jgi:hypothetical protein
MRASILQRIFRRVQVSRSEGIVLDAILSKANLFGKHARVAYECIAGITGFSIRHVMRLVKSLIYERRLLRVDKQVLWPGHNAINIYHVVIPWRADPLYNERQRMGWGRKHNKGPAAPDPHIKQEEKSLTQPAQTCSKYVCAKVASAIWTTGTGPWYHSQGLTPPWEEAENGKKGGNEG